FSRKVTEAISRDPLITIRREEVVQVEADELTIIATGPPTSDALSREIVRLISTSVSAGKAYAAPSRAGAPAPHNNLYFYDSISPIVEADSIDMSKVYLAARYDKGSADY